MSFSVRVDQFAITLPKVIVVSICLKLNILIKIVSTTGFITYT